MVKETVLSYTDRKIAQILVVIQIAGNSGLLVSALWYFFSNVLNQLDWPQFPEDIDQVKALLDSPLILLVLILVSATCGIATGIIFFSGIQDGSWTSFYNKIICNGIVEIFLAVMIVREVASAFVLNFTGICTGIILQVGIMTLIRLEKSKLMQRQYRRNDNNCVAVKKYRVGTTKRPGTRLNSTNHRSSSNRNKKTKTATAKWVSGSKSGVHLHLELN